MFTCTKAPSRFAAVLAVCTLFGCASSERVVARSKEQTTRLDSGKIVAVALINGNMIRFDQAGAQHKTDFNGLQHAIVGRTTAGEMVAISFDQVDHVYVAHHRAGYGEDASSVVFTMMLLAGLVAIR